MIFRKHRLEPLKRLWLNPDNNCCFKPGKYFLPTGNIWALHHSQEKEQCNRNTKQIQKFEEDYQQLVFKGLKWFRVEF